MSIRFFSVLKYLFDSVSFAITYFYTHFRLKLEHGNASFRLKLMTENLVIRARTSSVSELENGR